MGDVLSIFFRARGTNPGMVLVCLILAGVASGIGLVSMLPLLALANKGDTGSHPFITQFVTETLAFVGMKPALESLLAMVIGAITVKCLLTLVAMRYVGDALATVATGMRLQLIKQLLNVRWDFFTTQPLGRFANAVSLEATNSGKAYDMAANFLANGIQTVVYLGIAVVVSWKLALTALLMGGAIAFSLHSLVRMSRRAGHRQNERTRELVVYLSDALNSIKPLKAMAKQGSFALLFDRKIYSLKKALRRQIVSLEARKSFEEILITGCLGASFYVAVAVWSYQISDVLVMGILLVQTMRNVGKIQELFQKAVLLQSPYRSLIDLISEVTEAREKGGGARVPTLNEGCRFESVSFSFAQSPVLANATFDIPANRITVFTGPSGSGKTTIADLLLGLRYPEGGRILIDGMLLDEVDLEKWRGMIGYVPQELILFHDTVFTNVALGDPTLGEADVRHALEVAGAWEFVAAMPNGMMSHVGEKGAKLSGGQRQRIALARALVGKPKLMILDEVTSALDPEIERDICLRIQKFAKDMTVIAITHRSAFLEIADHLYRVEGGRVERLSAGDLAALVLAT